MKNANKSPEIPYSAREVERPYCVKEQFFVGLDGQGWIRTGTARNAVPVKFFTTGTAFRLRFCRFATAYRA